jgi:sulfonate transport system substrate-binding protein
MSTIVTARRFFAATLATGALGLFGIAAGLLGARNAHAQPAQPAELRVGFQKSSVNLVILKQRGILERRFPNTKVSWVEFPAGPQQLEALSAGSIDLSMTGDTPPVFAQAAGKDIVYIGVEPPKPQSSAILVKQASPLKTLADLKGKKIALQKGSSAHFLVVRAVEKAGLTFGDIQPIYLTPADARAAFERGAVDAWAIWDPYYAATELSIKPRVLANGVSLSSNNSFYFTSREFVARYPGVIATLLEELSKADRLVQEDRKGAAQFVSDFSGLNLATVHLFLSRRPPSPVAPLTAATIAEQQRVADTFFKLGLIPKQVQVSQAIWTPPASGRLASATTPTQR